MSRGKRAEHGPAELALGDHRLRVVGGPHDRGRQLAVAGHRVRAHGAHVVEHLVDGAAPFLLATLGEPEHLEDHGRGQDRAEVVDVVEARRADERIEQTAADPLDARLQPFDRARREGTVHELTESRVLGRIEPDHHRHVDRLGSHHLERGRV